jgi:hypothetical protein
MFTASSRRRFLKSAGTLLALPSLESLGFRRFARAAAAARRRNAWSASESATE